MDERTEIFMDATKFPVLDAALTFGKYNYQKYQKEKASFSPHYRFIRMNVGVFDLKHLNHLNEELLSSTDLLDRNFL